MNYNFSLSNGSDSCLYNHTGDIIHPFTHTRSLGYTVGKDDFHRNARRCCRICTGSNPITGMSKIFSFSIQCEKENLPTYRPTLKTVSRVTANKLFFKVGLSENGHFSR